MRLLLALVIFGLPAVAAAQNVGQCGWGSKLFNGQKGIIPQVFAVTTNGTSGNQTFGISTGTSGCTQNGVVRSSWKTAAFIGANMERLASNMSVGQGESLSTLATLLDVSAEDRSDFYTATRNSFGEIFTSSEVKSEQVFANLMQVLAADKKLSKYVVS